MSNLSNRDLAVLRSLCWFTDQAESGKQHRKWARPMDVGGSNGSHHGRTLVKLRKLGLAQCKVYGGDGQGCRQTFYYQISDAGRDCLGHRAIALIQKDPNA